MESNIIHLVMGISSSGKSTFIENKINNGEWQGIPLLMAYELEASVLSEGCIVHYNLFRPYDNNAENIANSFLQDTALVELLQYKRRLKIYFLVVNRSVLTKRILLRQEVVELNKEKAAYPHQAIFELMCRLDFDDFHREWIELFNLYNIEYEIINADEDSYSRVDSVESMHSCLRSDYPVEYSRSEIEKIVGSNDFEYQKIKLPYGIHTEGQDRSVSLQLLDGDLTGKSVLDIGCAYGFFCFEAENRNAARIVGTELKRHRFVGANIIKEISGSKAEIIYSDIFSEPLKEDFDIVILLNVIHHLKVPIKSLRMIADICKEKLIIEFPTLADEKFLATIPGQAEIDADLPLIGVSLQEHYDQTFLFSEKAIERILLEHESLFSRIEFRQSPMDKNRSVAICHK